MPVFMDPFARCPADLLHVLPAWARPGVRVYPRDGWHPMHKDATYGMVGRIDHDVICILVYNVHGVTHGCDNLWWKDRGKGWDDQCYYEIVAPTAWERILRDDDSV